jgi:hypothetical protein
MTMASSISVMTRLGWAGLLWVAASCGGTTGETDGSGDATEGSQDESGTSDGADDTVGVSGCRKVDVIIATDYSSSLVEEREALAGPVIESFPAQLLAINGGIDDFHLAVIDGCPKPAYFHDTGRSGACELSTGANYMLSSSPELTAEFACVTDLISTGYMGQEDMCLDEGELKDDDEQAALTAAEAVSGAAVTGANAGFLRDDALLFVVSLTDEDEQVVDVASTQEIYDRLVAAKGGDVSKVVYLGIGGGSECEGPYGETITAVQVQSLAALFEAQGRGMFWDLCMSDLPTAFQAAVEGLVDGACQEFSP